jgi:hypothetical protein
MPPDESNFISANEINADCWEIPPGLACREPVPESADMVRVYNATPNTIVATNNKWGTCDQYDHPPAPFDCMCPYAFFPPNPHLVVYDPWTEQTTLHACMGLGGPLFSGIAMPESAPEGAWPNPFNGQIHVRYRAGGSPSAGSCGIWLEPPCPMGIESSSGAAIPMTAGA